MTVAPFTDAEESVGTVESAGVSLVTDWPENPSTGFFARSESRSGSVPGAV